MAQQDKVTEQSTRGLSSLTRVWIVLALSVVALIPALPISLGLSLVASFTVTTSDHSLINEISRLTRQLPGNALNTFVDSTPLIL